MDRAGRPLSRRTGHTGTRDPRVLILAPRSDIAGVGIAIKRAFDKHSSIEVRQVRRTPRSYDYPHDAEWEERQALIEWADIVHVMEIPGAIPPGKPAVLHQHGSYARANLATLRRIRATHIGSTVDLPGEWLPNPVDPDLACYRKPGPLTIAHAPTNRTIKGTDAFLKACEGLPVEVLLIEGKSWDECLRLKGTADIYYDQLDLGYGSNAIEAWAMGIPVISGAKPELMAEMKRRFPIPFYPATEDTLRYAIADLVSSQVRRDHYGRLGLAHIREFHDERVVVRQLEDIYRRLA